MPTVRTACGAIVLIGETYLAGDMPPKGYLEHQEWYDAQRKAGLSQTTCLSCGYLRFPQEMAAESQRCLECEERRKCK